MRCLLPGPCPAFRNPGNEEAGECEHMLGVHICLVSTVSKWLTISKWWKIPMLNRKELEMQRSELLWSLSGGHMEKQETEMKRKLEMEIGNGNWKRKWEQKTHQSLVQCFLHSVLSHYSCILLSNGYRTAWLYDSCFAFTLVLCFVITAFE